MSGIGNIHWTLVTFAPMQQDRVGEKVIAGPDDCRNIKDDNYEEKVKMTCTTCKQSLLFVHQTTWQRRLLKRCGNNICLLDETYHTIRYSLPLFFLAVNTNTQFTTTILFALYSPSSSSFVLLVFTLHYGVQ